MPYSITSLSCLLLLFCFAVPNPSFAQPSKSRPKPSKKRKVPKKQNPSLKKKAKKSKKQNPPAKQDLKEPQKQWLLSKKALKGAKQTAQKSKSNSKVQILPKKVTQPFWTREKKWAVGLELAAQQNKEGKYKESVLSYQKLQNLPSSILLRSKAVQRLNQNLEQLREALENAELYQKLSKNGTVTAHGEKILNKLERTLKKAQSFLNKIPLVGPQGGYSIKARKQEIKVLKIDGKVKDIPKRQQQLISYIARQQKHLPSQTKQLQERLFATRMVLNEIRKRVLKHRKLKRKPRPKIITPPLSKTPSPNPLSPGPPLKKTSAKKKSTKKKPTRPKSKRSSSKKKTLAKSSSKKSSGSSKEPASRIPAPRPAPLPPTPLRKLLKTAETTQKLASQIEEKMESTLKRDLPNTLKKIAFNTRIQRMRSLVAQKKFHTSLQTACGALKNDEKNQRKALLEDRHFVRQRTKLAPKRSEEYEKLRFEELRLNRAIRKNTKRIKRLKCKSKKPLNLRGSHPPVLRTGRQKQLWNAIAQTHSAQGRDDKALRIRKDIQNRAPENIENLKQIARIQTRRGQNKQAAQTYQEILSHHPGEPSAYLALGRLAMKTKNYPEALKWYRLYLESRPDQSDIWKALHNIANQLKRPKIALNAVKQYEDLTGERLLRDDEGRNKHDYELVIGGLHFIFHNGRLWEYLVLDFALRAWKDLWLGFGTEGRFRFFVPGDPFQWDLFFIGKAAWLSKTWKGFYLSTRLGGSPWGLFAPRFYLEFDAGIPVGPFILHPAYRYFHYTARQSHVLMPGISIILLSPFMIKLEYLLNILKISAEGDWKFLHGLKGTLRFQMLSWWAFYLSLGVGNAVDFLFDLSITPQRGPGAGSDFAGKLYFFATLGTQIEFAKNHFLNINYTFYRESVELFLQGDTREVNVHIIGTTYMWKF